MKQVVFIIITLTSFLGLAQSDSSAILSFEEYLSIVREHHPIAKQARLRFEMGEAGILNARGAFDPKIQADVAQKYFKNKEYYDLGEGKLKVPTWFGIEMEGGYERNQGLFLNPENNTPNAGLWFAGISVPLGKGLFIDERRTELRKAQAMLNQNIAEQNIQLNELLFVAGLAYWEWFEAYHIADIYQDALSLAEQRYQAVKRGAGLGDLPPIDTLEAGIQYQNRQLSQQEATLNLKNKAAALSIFLWQEGLIPLELNEQTIPESLDQIQAEIKTDLQTQTMDSLLSNHPEIQKNRAKQNQLLLEERWNKEQLKPNLSLKYKPITVASEGNPFAEYSINNYTWGLQFEFPLFLRKERGKLTLTRLKLSENNYALSDKQLNLKAKLQIALNELETSKNLVQLSAKNQEDYKALLSGERQLFNNGESSLFLVNSREIGFISSELKLVNVLGKNRKAALKIQYTLAKLN